MLTNKYALIVRDRNEKKLGVVSTPKEPRTGTRHNGVSPSFLKHCRSILAFYQEAFSIEVVSLEGWSPGVNVETLPGVLWIEKAEEELPNALRYGFSVEEKASYKIDAP